MAKQTHRVTGLTNVRETWEQNEQKRHEGRLPEQEQQAADTEPATELDRVIREEAAAYDNENNEDRLLGGNRATRNDDV